MIDLIAELFAKADLRVWIGLFLLVVWIGVGYLRVRARRRSGKATSFGNRHPILDNLLLLAFGILLAALGELAVLAVVYLRAGYCGPGSV